MKYQITCDNCGTQFIVEAGEGQTIECKCPHCHGIMEITLPLVSAGQQYDQQPAYAPQSSQDSSGSDDGGKGWHTILWGVVIGLLLLAAAVGAYVALRPSTPAETPKDNVPVDTIPYEIPVEQEEPAPVVDTVVEAPVEEAPAEEENTEEDQQVEEADSVAVPAHDE